MFLVERGSSASSEVMSSPRMAVCGSEGRNNAKGLLDGVDYLGTKLHVHPPGDTRSHRSSPLSQCLRGQGPEIWERFRARRDEDRNELVPTRAIAVAPQRSLGPQRLEAAVLDLHERRSVVLLGEADLDLRRGVRVRG